MRELRIVLFGSFQLLHADQPVCALMLRKAQELLALMLLAPQRSVRREAAVDALWPAAGPAASRKAMRQALWQIHRAIDMTAPDAPRLVLTDAETVRINPERSVWLDVDEFAAAARTAQACRPEALTDAGYDRLAAACDLYRGPLLAGCDYEWCLVVRTHLEDLQLIVLDRLSVAAEHRGRATSAIHWAERLLEIEPAHERSHRRLMRLYYETDDRTRALRQYQRCRSVLERELGVRPSGRTEELAAAIGADAPAAPAPDDAPPPAPWLRVQAAGRHPARSDDDLVAAVASAWPTRLFDGFRAELAALRASVDAINDQLRGSDGRDAPVPTTRAGSLPQA